MKWFLHQIYFHISRFLYSRHRHQCNLLHDWIEEEKNCIFAEMSGNLLRVLPLRDKTGRPIKYWRNFPDFWRKLDQSSEQGQEKCNFSLIIMRCLASHEGRNIVIAFGGLLCLLKVREGEFEGWFPWRRKGVSVIPYLLNSCIFYTQLMFKLRFFHQFSDNWAEKGLLGGAACTSSQGVCTKSDKRSSGRRLLIASAAGIGHVMKAQAHWWVLRSSLSN